MWGRFGLSVLAAVCLAAFSDSALCMTTGEGCDSLLVMFWNVENFYDYTDEGSNSGEREFSSSGSRHWTKGRFYAKCNAFAKSVLWTADRYGRLPDVIGLAEIENSGVLKAILGATALKKCGYSFVHSDSADPRGSDVALFYRKPLFRVRGSRAVAVRTPEGVPLRTRDILHVCLERNDGRVFHFAVNHHPSKFGGSRSSGFSRKCAMDALSVLCDSLIALDDGNIVLMGDFNESATSDAFDVLGDRMTNLAFPLAEKGEGTIRYQGRWDLIDIFFVRKGLESVSEMNILRIPFLMVQDRAHPGEKPLRTYSGPGYQGGVSDHCPIVLLQFY